MNEAFDLEIDRVLRRAGAAAEPAEARLDRVFERLQLDLAGLGRTRSSEARQFVPGVHASHLGARLRFFGWGALTASVGFWFGTQYAPSATEPSAAPPRGDLLASAPSPLSLAPGANPPAPASDTAALEHGTRAAERVASEPANELHRALSAPRAAKRPRSREQRTDERLDFRAVLDHLRRAERAERSGLPELALSLLDEIDHGAAPGILREERLLTRVLALCDQGDTRHARLRARELGQTTDDSIYASRLRASCVSEKEEP